MKLLPLLLILLFSCSSFKKNTRDISSTEELAPISFVQQDGFFTHGGKSFTFNGVVVVRALEDYEIKKIGILWDYEDENYIHFLDRGIKPTEKEGIYLFQGSFSGNPLSEKLRFFIELTNGDKGYFRIQRTQ